jgi:hypothetical protein
MRHIIGLSLDYPVVGENKAVHTIETIGTVTADHRLVVSSLPLDVPPGEHAVVVTIDPARQPRDATAPIFRSAYPLALTNNQMSFRREDIYEDADR